MVSEWLNLYLSDKIGLNGFGKWDFNGKARE